MLLLGCSAFFSACEMAFSVINTIRLKNLAADGNKRAAAVISMTQRYDRMLTTVLIGNNIVNIAATTIAAVLFVRILGDVGATVSTVVMTAAVLIFCEVTPKTVAKRRPERFAMSVVYLLKGLMWLFTPISFLFEKWQKLVASGTPEEPKFSEGELLTIVDESRQEGGLDEGESELIKSAIEFGDLTASDILTPRVAVEAVEENDGEDEIKRVFLDSGFSRLPVYRKTVDSIVGVLTQKDFFANMYGERKPVDEIMKPVSFITEQTPVTKILRLLQGSKTHLTVVSDEYGGTLGIVTMEDVLEELVGEIYDEQDDVDVEIQQISEDEYRVLGSADAGELFELLQIQAEDEFATVNGWIAGCLNKIPDPGDSFQTDGYTVTVTEADERKVISAGIKRNRDGQQ